MTTDSAPAHAPGSPIWTDVSSSDVAASTRFYSQLFGWEAEDQGEQMGHYTMFRQTGKTVAAVAPLMMPQQPVAWTTYICVQNAATTAEAVKNSGGQVLSGPMDVMDLGSLGIFADPAGAVFGVWQPGQFKGAELANTPNSYCWSELATRDLARAKSFYPNVFSLTVKSNTMPDGSEYVEWKSADGSVAGAYAMGDRFPAQVPPHWLIYFAVADTDATVKKAEGLGARIVAPAMDIPQGRFAVLSDPLGANFGVIKLPDAR